MGVHHDVVLGSLLDAVEIMVVGRLRVVIVATGNDVAHIATLHGVVAVLVHKTICLLEMALVVEGRRAGLVVHHKFHALRVCVAVEFLNVEVGIRCLEVEHIVFIVTEPVLQPMFQPSTSTCCKPFFAAKSM